jgi:hypothetical protein
LGFDTVLFACGTAAEVALLLLMYGVRAYRTQTAFFIYIAWGVLSDPLMYLIKVHAAPATYCPSY